MGKASQRQAEAAAGVGDRLRDAIPDIRVATRDDLRKLTREVERLSKRIDRLEKQLAKPKSANRRTTRSTSRTTRATR